MLKRLIKYLVDKSLGGFITGILIWALKYYFELPAVSRPVFFKFDWIFAFFNVPIPMWVLLLIVLAIIIYSKMSKFLKSLANQDRAYIPTGPEFINYTKDSFGAKNSVWSWQYKERYGKYDIYNILPCCLECGMPMDRIYNTTFNCWKCKLDGKQYTKHVYEDDYAIEKAIRDNIESGRYTHQY